MSDIWDEVSDIWSKVKRWLDEHVFEEEKQHWSHPHTQLAHVKGPLGKYVKGREWGYDGHLVKDINFTNHGYACWRHEWSQKDY